MQTICGFRLAVANAFHNVEENNQKKKKKRKEKKYKLKLKEGSKNFSINPHRYNCLWMKDTLKNKAERLFLLLEIRKEKNDNTVAFELTAFR